MRKFKDFVERREKLKEIHADIVKEEHLFVEERKKWVADNRNLYSDMNQFFVERCQWETEFKENHLKPLYEERCNVAKGIPSFWHTAMIANKMVSKQIAEKDEEALNFLNDIGSRRTADLKGFELEFTFDNRNPYFNNKVLTKKYEVKDDNQSVSLKALGVKAVKVSSSSLIHMLLSILFLLTTKLMKFRDNIIPHAISWYKFAEKDDSDYDDSDGKCERCSRW